MITNIFDRNLIRIISFLIISPGSKYNRKELKENTEMNNIPLDKTLKKLKSLHIIEEKNHLFSLNFQDDKINKILESIQKEYKEFNLQYKIFNLLIDITEKLSMIKEIKEVKLFGSYSKLIYNQKSDIDLAVIFYDKIKNKKKIQKKVDGMILKISKKSKKEIESHFFSEKDMKAKDQLIKEILRNNKSLI